MGASARTLRWLAAAVLAGVTAATGASEPSLAETLLLAGAQDHRCGPNVREKLAELGIARDDIKGVTIHRREVRRRVNNQDIEELKGYRAWVVPRHGKGNLAMDLFLNCRVQRTYTMGGFTLP